MAIRRTGSLDQALNRLVASKAQHVKVGIMENSKYPDGQYVANVAYKNEYGTRGNSGKTIIPPRPFFRDTIKNEKVKWIEMTKKCIRAGYTIEHTLELVGLQMQQDVQYSVITWTEPPNAPYTVRMKGFNSPLRHTLLMHDSILSEVVDSTL